MAQLEQMAQFISLDQQEEMVPQMVLQELEQRCTIQIVMAGLDQVEQVMLLPDLATLLKVDQLEGTMHLQDRRLLIILQHNKVVRLLSKVHLHQVEAKVAVDQLEVVADN